MHTRSILVILLVMLFYSACNSTKKSSTKDIEKSTLLDNEWILSSWESNDLIQKVNTQSPIKMSFDTLENKVTGNDGCNTFFGSFTYNTDVLLIGATGGTKMYCGEESSKWEQSFSTFIQTKPRYKIEKNTLILNSKTNKLIFNPIK